MAGIAGTTDKSSVEVGQKFKIQVGLTGTQPDEPAKSGQFNIALSGVYEGETLTASTPITLTKAAVVRQRQINTPVLAGVTFAPTGVPGEWEGTVTAAALP